MLGEFTKVKTFTEKPDLELAKVFMESGEFFWNSGLFVWNVNTILEAFSKFLPDISLRFDLGKEKFNTAIPMSRGRPSRSQHKAYIRGPLFP